jgi:hypothetical protein
MQKR